MLRFTTMATPPKLLENLASADLGYGVGDMEIIVDQHPPHIQPDDIEAATIEELKAPVWRGRSLDIDRVRKRQHSAGSHCRRRTDF